MVPLRLISLIFSTVIIVNAVPQKASQKESGSLPVSVLTDDQVHFFRPYGHYAAAAACGASTTLTWTCGTHCEATPSFKPVASGGDGSITQFWYVGYDPTLETIIVSHQGTDIAKIIPLITDALIFMSPLNPSLFPGVSSGVQVHHGFGFAQEQSATQVLEAVKTAMANSGFKKVTVAGHSLGAAIALISSAHLALHLPSDTTFRTIVYGLPRVGNKAFADYMDAHANVSHINNKSDLVPEFPDRILGYVHPKGELHIVNSGAWVDCPGQENNNGQCTNGYAPNIIFGAIGELLANQDQHGGPYDSVHMGC
ncbi:Alpha/Beta hydrolase protein [Collybia nuda]|uniref:Alpha/Beta hydrolase protein n=1 Tax=Collybia nuda TaxID=64659 RepID=A0A9P6CCK7_9AGAR|nr:Alpha/Beta hydrolase protein [Collybia nuda]